MHETIQNIYNRLRNQINIHENYYVINSNYIMKILNEINRDNLDQNEKNELNEVISFINLSKKIIDKYIPYFVFNSKINNIYNYKNKFLLFMGENYFLIPYSLTEKKFVGLESSNFIQNNSNNFNNFEIIHIFNNKILINNSKDKTIKIIEHSNIYSFCLVDKSLQYYSNVQAYKNYLLFDKVINNELIFSLFNLDNYSEQNNFYINFSELLNFKMTNNPPKIFLNKNLSKFIYLLEDDNQINEIEFTSNKKINFREENEQILELKLNKENREEIVPTIHAYSSYYDKDYKPQNILYEKDYFCTKKNKNEFITFKFDKEYNFYKIIITYPDRYKTARLKDYKILAYDNQGNFLKSSLFNSNNDESQFKIMNLNVDVKAAYLKFELNTNYGENYFCIQRIQFFAEINHSLSTE